jgi:hypothetical protein
VLRFEARDYLRIELLPSRFTRVNPIRIKPLTFLTTDYLLLATAYYLLALCFNDNFFFGLAAVAFFRPAFGRAVCDLLDCAARLLALFC